MNFKTFNRFSRKLARGGLFTAAFGRKQEIAPSTYLYRRRRFAASLIQGDLAELRISQPPSGHLFAFVNRQKNRAKMLLWERVGFRLLSRRLGKGVFAMPAAARGDALPVDRVQRAMFLDDVVAERIRR